MANNERKSRKDHDIVFNMLGVYFAEQALKKELSRLSWRQAINSGQVAITQANKRRLE